MGLEDKEAIDFHSQPDIGQSCKRCAPPFLGGGDVVLIAGKGHEGCQEVADEKIPFDDRKEARAAMDARRKARGEERV